MVRFSLCLRRQRTAGPTTDHEFWTQIFRDGRQLWKEERFDEAIAVFERIITRRPEHYTTLYSVDIIITTKNYAQLEEFIYRVRCNVRLLDSHPLLLQQLELVPRG